MGAIFYAYENYETVSLITNCNFSNNSASTTLIDLDLSIFQINNSFFSNNFNIAFYAINSTFLIYNITLIDHSCSSLLGCIFAFNENSELILLNSSFENIYNFLPAGNMLFESSNAQLDTIYIKNIFNSNQLGACISCILSNLTILSSNFQNYSINCISSTSSHLYIIKSIFNNYLLKNTQNILEFGAIYCFKCTSIEILNSSFSSNSNIMKGGGIYIMNNNENNNSMKYMISNNIFIMNNALYGGALYLYNVNVLIFSCLFEKNMAEQGGSVYLDNDGNINKKIDLNLIKKT